MRFLCFLRLQEQLISGSSPKLGWQFALAIAHPCGDELDNQGACRTRALERDGLFPMGCLGASAVVPGIKRSVRGRYRSLAKECTSRAETREMTGDPKRFPTMRVQHAETILEQAGEGLAGAG